MCCGVGGRGLGSADVCLRAVSRRRWVMVFAMELAVVGVSVLAQAGLAAQQGCGDCRGGADVGGGGANGSGC